MSGGAAATKVRPAARPGGSVVTNARRSRYGMSRQVAALRLGY